MGKFNEYTEKLAPDDVDIFLLQDTAATKKVTFLSIFNQIKSKLGLGLLATKNKISQEDLEAALLNLINGKLTASGMSNDLITTDATKALAAPQGKKLLDFIGTLTALTTTEKTNLVLAINELVTSIDALNRNLQVATVTPAKSGNIAGNPTIKQSGYVKMLKVNTTITLNMAVGTEYILCTLAVAQRPDADYIKYLSQGRLTISALGSVTFSPTTALPSGQYIHIAESFI